MADQMDRDQIEAAREDLLDKLALAKSRLTQVSFAAAMPGGDENAMIQAEEAVRRIEQKLEGLNHGLHQVSAREEEQRANDQLARRRERAVELLSLVYRRSWKTEALDEALNAVELAIEDIDDLGQQIMMASAGWFGEDTRGADNRRNFLLNIDALDLTDTVTRVRSDIGHPRRYAAGLPLTRAKALAALALAMPEVNDPSVKEEALALARQDVTSVQGQS